LSRQSAPGCPAFTASASSSDSRKRNSLANPAYRLPDHERRNPTHAEAAPPELARIVLAIMVRSSSRK
jgi:hypothetical protein